MENRQTELILDALAPLRPDGRVLDAGSGRGGTAFMLHDRFGCHVDGVTLSAYQVEFASRLARERGSAGRVAFHLRNMVRTGFGTGTFDGVVTNETTMYVDLFEAFKEFSRLLAFGGRYVCITGCYNDVTGGRSGESATLRSTAFTTPRARGGTNATDVETAAWGGVLSTSNW